MLLLMHRIVVLHTEWTLLYCTYKVCNLCSWYQNWAPTCLKNTSFFIFFLSFIRSFFLPSSLSFFLPLFLSSFLSFFLTPLSLSLSLSLFLPSFPFPTIIIERSRTSYCFMMLIVQLYLCPKHNFWGEVYCCLSIITFWGLFIIWLLILYWLEIIVYYGFVFVLLLLLLLFSFNFSHSRTLVKELVCHFLGQVSRLFIVWNINVYVCVLKSWWLLLFSRF